MILHHWVLIECVKEFETEYLQNNSIPDAGICVDTNGPRNEWTNVNKYCYTASLVWAVGGSQVQNFPDDMAYPLGGSEDEFKYFYLQLHYNNLNHESIRFFYICAFPI
jgi:hypothetical protein